ncbi:deleted in azoospermia-like isoform X2 [Hemicordylus capensis]|uniref:deleted in azoospermia-like isoform X2 n=1 Tax=Hemicordylus capensis TaxID=884348 RepID=UPI002303AD78|nr:deleted in azoospermia-like isoform X2 [Hemicordylus capensis]
MSAANQDTQNASISGDESSPLPATNQGYVLPEGKIMPNTIFVGGIDIRMDETEIRSFFARYGTVKEVKIITDRTGVSKGYGFVSFLDNVDVQKIVESQINFHGKKLKLGPAIRKHPNLCAYHVPPRPVLINSPTPQFHSVWSNQETYMQPPAMMSPVTQYVQAYPYGSPALVIQQQVPIGYQPTYNYQVPPQWPPGEPRNYIVPPAYTTVNYGGELDVGTEQAECSMAEATQSCGNSPQKKSVDRSIQTVVSCLCNPDNRLRNNIVTQEDYLKEKRAHHFRRSRAVLKTV